MKNLVKCMGLVGVNVDELVFSGIASSQAVLSDTEKELGVVLVDIGGETTDVVVFVDGAVAYSAVVPVGARHITSDLAVGLRVSLESAEKIKQYLGQKSKIPAMPSMSEKEEHRVHTPASLRNKGEVLDFKAIGIPEELPKNVTKESVINSIIRPRVREIFELVGKEIKKSGFGSQTPSGLVICGGGALTVGLLEQAKYVLGFPARLGKPEGLQGLTDEIDSPVYATAAGLIMYGVRMGGGGDTRMPVLSKGLPLKGIMQRGLDILKSFLP
jgi:cell division protein FtsA